MSAEGLRCAPAAAAAAALCGLIHASRLDDVQALTIRVPSDGKNWEANAASLAHLSRA